MDDFSSATVGGFRAALMTGQSCGALLMIKGAQLEVSLTAEAKFLRGLGRTGWTAFAFDKHGQLIGHLIFRTY